MKQRLLRMGLEPQGPFPFVVCSYLGTLLHKAIGTKVEILSASCPMSHAHKYS